MNAYLLWLEWPERCFRLNAEDLRCFRALVPKGSRITVARSQAAFLRALPKATHAVVWSFSPEWFARAPRLKVLTTPAAGHELVPETGPEGVRIGFGGFHGEIIAESVVGFVLAWAHGFFSRGAGRLGYADYRRKMAETCYTVAGTTALIVGYGHVGKVIGRRLEAFGVAVEGFGRKNARDLPKAARRADWLVLALPATKATDDFLDAKLIAKLPRRCVVINVGRGNAIEEGALLRALRAGKIAGAYLDVCKGERSEIWSKASASGAAGIDPLDETTPNLVMMPHSCAFSPEYLRMSFRGMKDDGLI